ncbi:Phox homologous domain-containing protein [Mucor mucedo]|uniref:Phox homologous domain-containing protein n=1 Tax=Mucor mucedo TaxID=29922 RepID=UPI00221FD370|nr:Phox homologous domain-containing protein [Mucor mucedo]KAI7891831.1 Phox homologous domain-containing protein [Mucor mucedo]
MPTAISTEHPLMLRPSFSTNTPTQMTSVKLATAITKATVISFERLADQKIWYTIRVEPNASKKYFISRKYEDFIQFSQKLHDRFNTTKYRAGSRLPPKIKSRLLSLPNKQIHSQRVQELNQFLTLLLQKPSIVTESFLVHDFFGADDTAEDVFVKKEYAAVDYVIDQDSMQPEATSSSRWKRLRCTSFLASRSPPSSGLSSLCSQAANKIIPSWHRNNTTAPQPSVSTPAISSSSSSKTNTIMTGQQQRKQVLKKSQSSLGIVEAHHPLDDSVVTPTISHHDTHQLKSTIKIKVIYDADNIIVIQVPRSISLVDLRSRIAQKFSDPSMGAIQVAKDLILLFNDNSSSCCSLVSSPLKNDIMLPAVLINKEQDLVQIMHTKWNRLEKVTLRCIM